jgi:hypothetical protein
MCSVCVLFLNTATLSADWLNRLVGQYNLLMEKNPFLAGKVAGIDKSSQSLSASPLSAPDQVKARVMILIPFIFIFVTFP